MSISFDELFFCLFSVFFCLGVLMGCAIRSTTCLSLDIATFFFKVLLHGSGALLADGLDRALLELSSFDLNASRFLQFQYPSSGRPLTPEEFDELDLTYTTTLSDGRTTVELCDGGRNAQVQFADRWKYCEMVCRARLEESDRQVAEIRKGLHSVIPSLIPAVPLYDDDNYDYSLSSSLHFVTREELELRICGQPIVDLTVLKKHTKYKGADENTDVVKNFWRVLESFSDTDRGRFLQFAWARSRLPVDMSSVHMTVNIESDRDQKLADMKLPKSQTCFCIVDLPRYSTFEIMKEKIAMAINCVDINF